jgi:UDP-N-acetylmuramyl pentapeptide phosphotransferase/UDP-N-acetylglucosamine-1-phosphate transferase
VLDIPNERSLHSDPVPRTGGIAILFGTGAGLLIAWYGHGHLLIAMPLSIAVIVLALVALIDDRHNLGAGIRLLAQFAAVLYLLLNSPMLDFGTPATIVALLFLVWMINLYNFMDGMDGFAGGMAIFGFGTYAVLAWLAGNLALTLACGMLVAACGGFLLQNFPPARIFMGDVGSTVLGLLAGITILQSHRSGLLPVWFGILIFSPFIADASVTIAARIVRGEQFWKAHKSHCYQKIAQAGWGHRRTVLAEYGLMLACSGSALFGATLPLNGQVLIIALWTLLYALLIGFVRRRTTG